MTDNLPPTGVQLVAEGAVGFLRVLSQGKGALGSFEAAASSAGTKGVRPLGFMAQAAASFVGNVLSAAVIKGTQALFGFTRQGIAATSEVQNLTIKLESLIAKEIKQAGAAEDMADALRQAAPAAQAVLNQIERISLISPFQYQDVVQVFTLNKAFGASTAISLKLTQAILDMTAAMGQSGFMMQRIAYNFSQMSLVGKVTMRDVRDLAMAGVDLADVLRTQLGMSIDEVNKALQSGKITMADVSTAFVRYAEENFGGAAQRMSRTFQGVLSSLKDLVFFTSTDLFGPSLQSVTNLMGDLLDKLMAVVKSGALEYLGKAFGALTDMGTGLVRVLFNIPEAMGEIEPATEGLALVLEKRAAEAQEAFITRLKETATAAVQWGANITVSLAQGIMAGAAALIQALNWIGGILSDWLSPGSPPKIAPGLPDWGAAAMTEFLKGFTQADFGVLKSIQGTLQSFFSSQVLGGFMSAQESADAMLELSKDLIKGLSTGNIDGVLSQISKLGGDLGPQLAKLTKDQLALADATEAVKAAEEKLIDARKAQFEATNKAGELTKEYNDLLKAGADEATLAAKLAEIQAAEESADSYGEQAEAAEEELEAAHDVLEPLAEKVALQQALVDQLLELARLNAQANAAAAAGGGGGGADEGFVPEIPPLELPPPPDTSDLEEFGHDLGKIIDDALNEIERSFRSHDFPSLFDELGKTWGNVWDGVVAKVPFVVGILATFGAILHAIFSGISEAVGNALENIQTKMDEAGIGALDWGKIFSFIGLFIVGLFILLGAIISGILGGIIAGFGQWVEQVKEIFDGLSKGVNMIMEGDLKGGILQILQSLFFGMLSILFGWIPILLATIDGFIGGVWDYFNGLYSDLVGADGLVGRTWGEFKDKVVEKLTEIYDSIVQWFTDAFAYLSSPEFIETMKQSATDMLQGFLDGLIKFWDEVLWPWIQEHFGAILDLINEIFGNASPSKEMRGIAHNAMKGFTLGLEDMEKAPANVFERSIAAMMAPAPITNISNHSTQSLEFNLTTPVNNRADGEMVRLIVRDEIRQAFRGA